MATTRIAFIARRRGDSRSVWLRRYTEPATSRGTESIKRFV
jgi:hypothetical protein